MGIEAGYTVKAMEGSKRAEAPKSGFTMQLIELASTEEAIGAVANLHNTWPKKMGTKNKDHFQRERGLNFSFAGSLKAEREKAKTSKKINWHTVKYTHSHVNYDLFNYNQVVFRY